MINVWRREFIPEISYGELPLAPNRMRWLWTRFLVGSTLAAVSGDPVVISTYSFEEPNIEASLPPGAERAQGSLDLPLPFYLYTRQLVTGDGNILEETVAEGIPLPWGMMTAVLAYFVLVVGWNPENRWALRILGGKRWVRKNGPRSSRRTSGSDPNRSPHSLIFTRRRTQSPCTPW